MLRERPGGVTLADPTHGKLDAGGLKQIELWRTYGAVVSFLLQLYKTDEFIAGARTDVDNFRQGIAVIEKLYLRTLWN